MQVKRCNKTNCALFKSDLGCDHFWDCCEILQHTHVQNTSNPDVNNLFAKCTFHVCSSNISRYSHNDVIFVATTTTKTIQNKALFVGGEQDLRSKKMPTLCTQILITSQTVHYDILESTAQLKSEVDRLHWKKIFRILWEISRTAKLVHVLILFIDQ